MTDLTDEQRARAEFRRLLERQSKLDTEAIAEVLREQRVRLGLLPREPGPPPLHVAALEHDIDQVLIDVVRLYGVWGVIRLSARVFEELTKVKLPAAVGWAAGRAALHARAVLDALPYPAEPRPEAPTSPPPAAPDEAPTTEGEG